VTQKGVELVVQQTWPDVQEVFPQQVFPFGAQNGVVLVLQQTWVLEQEVLPQQLLPLVAQNGVALVVQHNWLEEEQHSLPVPHCTVPLAQPGFELACAAAGLTPSAARIPPARAPLTSLSAWRRGIGLARIRATLSSKDCISMFLSLA
jgi:hypothetical protein